MTKLLPLASVALVAWATAAIGQESPTPTESEVKPIKATFLITGLHCPPCTKTVQSSLQNVDGIVSVKVDWKSKKALIEFDETVLPAQQIGILVAKTPHMMGGNMHYAGWLALKAPEITDGASAKRAEEALRKVKGVSRVATYPAQHSLSVSFDKKGKLTTGDLIVALKEAGFHAEPL